MTIFKRLKLDVTVMDVGIGGRLDATDAIPDKVVVVILVDGVHNQVSAQGFLPFSPVYLPQTTRSI